MTGNADGDRQTDVADNTRRKALAPRGPAYGFWLRVRQEAEEQGISIRALVTATGVPEPTIARLQTSAGRTPHERRQHVETLADHLGIPRAEAYVLAGLRRDPDAPPPPSVRDSIILTDEYDADQKRALLALVDLIDTHNARTGTSGNTGGVTRKAN